MNVEAIQKDFPVLQRQIYGKRLVYLDSAATTLKPWPVIRVMQNYLEHGTASVHRSVHKLGEETTLSYESTRDKAKSWINARETSEIIFTSGVTHAINLVAFSYGRTFLGTGDEIVLTQMEHHSNIVPWQILAQEKGCKIRVVDVLDDGSLDMDSFARQINRRTKLVACVAISNSLGTINPIREIVRMSHEVGAVCLIDGAQQMLHGQVDVQDLGCDFFAISGHKMLGPTGCGILYGRKELLESMPPFLSGGDMIRSVSFEGTTYAPPPARFEAGTPPICEVIGLGAAFDYLKALDFKQLRAHELDLLAYSHESLQQVPGLRIIGESTQKASIVSFVVEGIHPHDLGTLVDQDGIAIRTGHHCTQPLMQRFGVPATARASLTLYNDRSDIDALVASLIKAQGVFA